MILSAAFIDGANLAATARSLNLDIDFKPFRNIFQIEGQLLTRCSYFTALREEEDGTINLKKLVDFLSFNGYHMVTKAAKQFRVADGSMKTKGNVDVEIAVDAMLLAAHGVRVMYFVTGDGDFKHLLVALQSMAVKCIVISTIKGDSQICANELRAQADEFWDLADFMPNIKRRRVDANE